MARKRRRGAGCLAVVLLLAVGAAAVIWLPDLLDRHAYKLETQSCVATHGEYVDFKTAEQANNAAIIAAVGMSYGFDVQGVTVALATAIQESDLRSLDFGDRDSLGLFQQRPSQGWGEPEQVMDPHYASSKFYQALERVAGWEEMPLTEAAQAVQRSGFPDAYADHESEARAWATALTGGDAVIDCHNPDGTFGSAQGFAERLSQDYGAGRYTVEVVDVDGARTTLAITAVDGNDAAAQSVREWVVATASVTGAIESSSGGQAWVNGEGRRSDAESEQPASPVTVVIATD
jgi:hypothetical protein